MNNCIYQGDCLEVMKDIPSGSVDLILCDPPYGVGASSNGVKSSIADLSLIKPFFDLAFSECSRVLKNGKHIYINTDWRTYPLLYLLMSKYFTVRNLIVWNHKLLRMGNWYRFSYELIIFATKGESKRQFSGAERDIFEIKPEINELPPRRLHKSQKPIELCRKMILNSSAEGEVVLDFCCGSGSTCVAAVEENRQFIGIELDEKYFDVACDRVVAAQDKIYERS